MSIDEPALRELITESNDLHLDALRTTRGTLPELASVREDRRTAGLDAEEVANFNLSRRTVLAGGGTGGIGWLSRGIFAGGLGTALTALMTSPASADEALDIQILQTAVSLETLAVATYGAALDLDFIKNGNAVIVTFARTTMGQHADHRDAFNSQARALGGKAQTKPNPKYSKVVKAATPGLKAPGNVVMLAMALETVATQTYVKNASLLRDATTKALMASVTGVEAQHLATLRAVGALLGAGKPELIDIPTVVADLPAAAGAAAFPKPFEGTEMASPPQEGAVK
ncbi:MAG: ferritin-like domain-containing protein [Acidimicrobiales bacterium]